MVGEGAFKASGQVACGLAIRRNAVWDRLGCAPSRDCFSGDTRREAGGKDEIIGLQVMRQERTRETVPGTAAVDGCDRHRGDRHLVLRTAQNSAIRTSFHDHRTGVEAAKVLCDLLDRGQAEQFLAFVIGSKDKIGHR